MSEDDHTEEPKQWRFCVASLLFVLGVAMIYLAPANSGRTPEGTPYYNAAWFMPVVALVLMSLAACWEAWTHLHGLNLTGRGLRNAWSKIGLPARFAVAFGLYIQLTLFVGFFLASAVTLTALFWVTGLRRPAYFVLAVGLALSIDFIFLEILDIWMPASVLPVPFLFDFLGA